MKSDVDQKAVFFILWYNIVLMKVIKLLFMQGKEYVMEKMERNLELFLENTSDGVYIVDKAGKIVYWNKSATEITGYSSSEIVGTYCHKNALNHIDSNGNKLCVKNCPLVNSTGNDRVEELDIFICHRDGYHIPIFVRVLPYKDKNGEIIGIMKVFKNTSDCKEILKKMKELEKIAMLDGLTQLPNRRFLEKTIDTKLDQYRLNDIKFGLIFIDVDNFKQLNDNYGHLAGDLVLKNISKTFANNLADGNIIGRWGGEEFLGIFSNIYEKDMEKLKMLVEKTNIKVKDRELKVTISIGATLIRPEDTIESFLKRADELLYKSKKNGKNCVNIG